MFSTLALPSAFSNLLLTERVMIGVVTDGLLHICVWYNTIFSFKHFSGKISHKLTRYKGSISDSLHDRKIVSLNFWLAKKQQYFGGDIKEFFHYSEILPDKELKTTYIKYHFFFLFWELSLNSSLLLVASFFMLQVYDSNMYYTLFSAPRGGQLPEFGKHARSCLVIQHNKFRISEKLTLREAFINECNWKPIEMLLNSLDNVVAYSLSSYRWSKSNTKESKFSLNMSPT